MTGSLSWRPQQTTPHLTLGNVCLYVRWGGCRSSYTFFLILFLPKCSELLGNSDFAKSIMCGCLVLAFQPGKNVFPLCWHQDLNKFHRYCAVCVLFSVVGHALKLTGANCVYRCTWHPTILSFTYLVLLFDSVRRCCVISWSEGNEKRTTSRLPLDNPLLAGRREELRAF